MKTLYIFQFSFNGIFLFYETVDGSDGTIWRWSTCYIVYKFQNDQIKDKMHIISQVSEAFDSNVHANTRRNLPIFSMLSK